jgi:hypothetical protein
MCAPAAPQKPGSGRSGCGAQWRRAGEWPTGGSLRRGPAGSGVPRSTPEGRQQPQP